MGTKVEFLKCDNRHNCGRERDSRFVIRSIGRNVYCSVRCAMQANGQQYNVKIVKIHR